VTVTVRVSFSVTDCECEFQCDCECDCDPDVEPSQTSRPTAALVQSISSLGSNNSDNLAANTVYKIKMLSSHYRRFHCCILKLSFFQ
jgi:hypothetical protein